MDIVLNTFGTALSCDNQAFVVTTKDGKQRIPPDEIKSISISKGSSISSDAVVLAIENEIEILFIERNGNPIGRIWSHKYGSISNIRKGQLYFTNNEESVTWIKDIIAQKINNQQVLLWAFSASYPEYKTMIEHHTNRMEKYRQKALQLHGENVRDIANELRGIEGFVSRIYFDKMNLFLLPEFRFKVRSQHPAIDPVNAILNYGYGILYGKIEGALIRAGIDPYLGVLHRNEYNRPVLVYDIIEKYRVWVDYVVFSLAGQHVINKEYYSIQSDGSCWLEGLGKRILTQSLNDYLSEVIKINSIERSRSTHIDLFCQSLAQEFRKFC